MLRSAFRAALALALFATGAASAQHVQYSSAHRDSEQAIPQTVPTTVSNAKIQSKLAASRTGTALVVADFDSDGTPDLISGYSTPAGGVLLLQRGSAAAHAPGPEEWAMRAAGRLVTPYKAKATVIDLPVSPDLLVTADVYGHGASDLVTAAKGGSTAYVLLGHGDGTFSAPHAVPLAGAVTSLATWRNAKSANLLVAGVCGASGCGLQFVDRAGATVAFVSTPAAPLAIQSARMNNGILADLAVVSNGRVFVIDGESALSGAPVTAKLSATSVASLALGDFVMDHRGLPQIAVLGADATLHVFAHAGVLDTVPALGPGPRGRQLPLDSTPLGKLTSTPWQEVETVPNVGSGGTPILVRAHLLGSGLDDLAVIAGNQYVTVNHRLSTVSGRTITTPVVTEDSTASPVQAALPARVSSDARQGVLLLGSGPRPLVVAQPATNKTLTVNTTADGNDSLATAGRCTGTGTCTLRDAVNIANNDTAANVAAGKVDVINVPAGTYTLSVYNPTRGTTTPVQYDNYGSLNYHLEVDGPTVINGAGIGQTIINGNHVDQVFSVNLAVYATNSANDFAPVIMDAFFSNMTIENGTNPNSFSNATCSANNYCTVVGGNIAWLSEGTTNSNLVLNNVSVINGLTAVGGSGTTGGGGIDSYIDTTSGNTTSGPLDIENSNFSSNQDRAGGGAGAIKAEYNTSLVLNNSTVTGNTSSSGATGPGLGGGIEILPNSGTATYGTITNSTISNNTAPSGMGGGLYNTAQLTMTGTRVTGNSALSYGGGIWTEQTSTYPASSITSSTFTTNALTGPYTGGGVTYTQDGAGVCIEPSFGSSAPPALTFAYNRVYGNTRTVSNANTGLALGCNSTGTTYANVNAANNWWGCNGAAAGTGCDTAHSGNVSSPTLTLSPYTTLALNLNATTVTYGSSVVATASLGQNSVGTIYAAASDTAYDATPITTFTLTNVGSSVYNPSATGFSTTAAQATSYAADTDTGTANATGTGTATLTVDGTTLTRTYTINAPDLSVTSAHSGNFKAGDTADTYTLTVANVGTASTSGTTTVTDTLPAGFVAGTATGSGWTCITNSATSVTCTSTAIVASSVTFPAITLPVSVGSTLAGTYTNAVAASGGGEANGSNDTATDPTIVIGQPLLAEAFSPTSVARGVASQVTFTLSNPSANSVSLTGVGFTDTLPTNLVVAATSGLATTCTGATATGAAGASSISLSGATIAAGASCTLKVNVSSTTPATYTNTTNAPTAGNSNAGAVASAVLTVTGDVTTTTVSLGATTGTVGGTTTGTVTVADAATPGVYNSGSVKVSNTVNGNTTTIGTYTFNGPGTANFTYNESYGGSNVVTAVFTPGDPSLAASADTTGKTIVVAKATPTAPTGNSDQSVSRNVASVFTFVFSYPGKIPPSGAITVTLNGSTLAVTPACIYKTTGSAPHANCTFTYTTTLADGQYPFTYSVASDNNYNAITGTSTITVIN